MLCIRWRGKEDGVLDQGEEEDSSINDSYVGGKANGMGDWEMVIFTLPWMCNKAVS